MPYIQLDETQIPLRVGAVRVGAVPEAEIRLPGDADPSAVAVVELGPDQSAAIRRANNTSAVRVNGVQLGVEPSPLLHGDKIEIGAHELLYGDDRKAGSTQFIPSLAALAGTSAGAAASAIAAVRRPTAATGGRLMSLVDGREYLVPEAGLVIGRDAGCDVVVPSGEVSRRHAAVSPVSGGYLLRDTSANGVFVNGVRVQGSVALGRGDVVKIGGEEFRFSADAPAVPPALAREPEVEPPVVPAPMPARPKQVTPPAEIAAPPIPLEAPPAPAPAASPLGTTLPPTPAPPALRADGAVTTPAHAASPAALRPLLATLDIVNEGLLKGRRFDVRSPLTHVGRGEHNDVVIPEESVSDSHAKLQKRDDGWFVVDMSSTNGTYVGGRRVTSEQALADGADVRFGGVKMVFRPAGAATEDAKGTRAIAGVSVEHARAPRAPRPAPVPVRAAPAPARGLPAWLWILALVLVAAAALFIYKGR